MVWGMYSGGVAWKYYSAVKFVGAVGAEMQFLQRGFEYELFRDSDTTYRRTLNSVVVPLIWQPYFYAFNRHVRVFMNLALTFSYNFDSWADSLSTRQGVYWSQKYDMQLVRDNRWGYGLCGGIGIGVLFDRWEVMVEGRYWYGYSDILKNRNKYATNPLRSPLDNITVSAGFFYRLGKKDLLIGPNLRAERRAAEREKRKMQKETILQNGNDKTTKSRTTDPEGR